MAIFANIKIQHKGTQTDGGQSTFYCASTAVGLLSIIPHLRIVWRLKKLDPKRVTTICTRMILASVFSNNFLRKIGSNFYLSVDSNFLKVNILSERERNTEKRFLQQSALLLFIEKNTCTGQTNAMQTFHSWGPGGTLTKPVGREKRKFCGSTVLFLVKCS